MKYYKISIFIYFGKAEFSAVITAVNSYIILQKSFCILLTLI